MTETPKRRGRPPGTKNKPKVADPASVSPLVPFENIETSLVGVELIKVILLGGAAFSKTPIEHEVEWPQGWPLPRQFESVVAGDIRGQVHFVTYDLDRRAVIIAFG